MYKQLVYLLMLLFCRLEISYTLSSDSRVFTDHLDLDSGSTIMKEFTIFGEGITQCDHHRVYLQVRKHCHKNVTFIGYKLNLIVLVGEKCKVVIFNGINTIETFLLMELKISSLSL